MKAANILQIIKQTKEQTNIRAMDLYDTDPEKYESIINDDRILIVTRSELDQIRRFIGDRNNFRLIMNLNDQEKTAFKKVRACIKESEVKDE